MAGGDDALTPEQIEKRCLARLAGLVADATVWPTDGFGESWRIGDFNILIVETTVAPNAEIYVQFWSEPRDVVLWEGSSGHANPALERYVTDAARTRLKEMGFAIGGQVNNFGRTVAVALGLSALAGIGYMIIVLRRLRVPSPYRAQLEDWIWHVVLPVLAYSTLLAAHLALRHDSHWAPYAIGGVALMLLFIGIHNAWDTVTYVVVSQRKAP